MTNEPFGQVQALEAAIKRLAAIVDDLVTAGEATILATDALRAAIVKARKHPFDSSHLAWCNHPPATSMDYCWSYADHVDGNPKFADLEKLCVGCDFRKEPPAEAAKK